MATIPAGSLGPHPKYAVLPVLLVLALLGWVAANNPAPVASPDAVTVVAMRPVDGGAEAPAAAASQTPSPITAAGLPIEVLYGVPSAATMDLWAPRR